jgi:hypothetical protein
MSQFKVGDRVKIVAGNFANETGTVDRRLEAGRFTVGVRLDNPSRCTQVLSYMESELEMIETNTQFKVGDKVKIGNTFPRAGQTGTIDKLVEGGAVVKFYENEQGLFYGFCVLEPVEQKPKTKTVRKYASVFVEDDGSICNVIGLYTEERLKQCDDLYFNGKKTYHIIPTIFEDVEVPVETETRWTFICKNPRTGDYYPTTRKYTSLEQAKDRTLNEAITKIDDSAEEFEIE